MAAIDPTILKISTGVFQLKWETITENDTPTAFDASAYVDRTIQISGDFGGGSIDFEGSNDGTTYSDEEDAENNAVSSIATTYRNTLRDNTRYIRPATPTGTSVDIDVTVIFRMYPLALR